MKVWYCSDGGVAWIEGMSPGDGVGCRPYWITEMGTSYQRDHVIKHGCGWMQLVPADALVIQKENGKWPSWTKEERWSDTSTPPKRRHTLVVFLDVPHD